MRERERIALREHRAQVEAEEQAEKDRIEAPIRAAQEKLNQTHRELYSQIRERIAHGRDREIFVSPALARASMIHEQAAKHNAASGREFLSRNSWFYNSPANLDMLIQYFVRNGINVIDAEMWERAAERLDEYHLFPEKRSLPQPELVIEPQPEPEPTGPTLYTGVDWTTGNERQFTQREIDRMSSAEYKRAFPVAPTFRELFGAMNELREQR